MSSLAQATGDAKIVGGRFRLVKRLGAGSFGEIFEVIDLKANNKSYACKAEPVRTKHPQLKQEYEIYQKLQHSKNFVRVYGIIPHGTHHLMIMDKLGESLEMLFNYCQRRFSIKTVCLIALQLISRIEELHSEGWLHRDIKPDNFLVGEGSRSSPNAANIYMIDLGLGKEWNESGRHIQHKTGKRLIGTPRYASINTHFGHEQSRRDDLESLGYMLMYFARGMLPWQGLKGETKEDKYKKIGQTKKTTSLPELCKGYPLEFEQYLRSCRNLGFAQRPLYDEYKKLFQTVLYNRGYDPNNMHHVAFDWQDKRRAAMPADERWPNRPPIQPPYQPTMAQNRFRSLHTHTHGHDHVQIHVQGTSPNAIGVGVTHGQIQIHNHNSPNNVSRLHSYLHRPQADTNPTNNHPFVNAQHTLPQLPTMVTPYRFNPLSHTPQINFHHDESSPNTIPISHAQTPMATQQVTNNALNSFQTLAPITSLQAISNLPVNIAGINLNGNNRPTNHQTPTGTPGLVAGGITHAGTELPNQFNTNINAQEITVNLVANYKDMEKQRDRYKKEVDQLQSQLNVERQEKERLQTRLHSAQQDVARYKMAYQTQSKKQNDYKKLCQDLKRENTALRSQHSHAMQAHNAHANAVEASLPKPTLIGRKRKRTESSNHHLSRKRTRTNPSHVIELD